MKTLDLWLHALNAETALQCLLADELRHAVEGKGKADPWRALHIATALASVVQIKVANGRQP